MVRVILNEVKNLGGWDVAHPDSRHGNHPPVRGEPVDHGGTGIIRSLASIEASPFRKGRLRGIFPRVILNEVKNLGGGMRGIRAPAMVIFRRS